MTDSINLTGSGGGGKKRGMADKVPYSRDDRAFGDYENREVGLRLRKAQDDLTRALRAAAQNWKLRNSTEERQNRELQSAQKDLVGVLQSSVKAYNYRKNAEARQEKEKQKVEKENWSQLSVSAKIYKLKNATLQKQRKEEDRIYKSERAIAESLNRDLDIQAAAKRRRQKDLNRVNVANGNAYGPFVGRQPSHYLYKPPGEAPRQPGMLGTAALGITRVIGGRPMAAAARQLFYPGSGGGGGGSQFRGGGGSGGGGGGFGVDDAAALLKGGAGVALAYEAAKLAWGAFSPNAQAARAGSWLGASSQYQNLQIGASNMGRQGGFSGSQLAGRIYSGGKLSSYLAQGGITSSEQAMGILGNYGTIGSAGEGESILKDVGRAFMMPGFGGMEHSRYASMLGGARELGITAPFEDSNASVSLPGMSKYKSRNEFMDIMGKAVAAGTHAGLDASRTSSVLENMMRSSISQGAATANPEGNTSLWWRLASGGDASARTGQMQEDFTSGTNAATRQIGYSGAPAQNASYYMWAQSQFSGGKPSSIEEFAKAHKVDLSKISGPDRKMVQDAYSRATKGDWAGAGNLMQDFIASDPNLKMSIFGSALGGVPDDQQGLAAAAAAGVSPRTYYNYQYGAQSVPTDERQTMKQVHDYYAAKGLSEQQIAGIMSNINAESGFDANNVGDGGTSYGLFQHHADRKDALFKYAGTNKPSVAQQLDFSWQELNGPYQGTLNSIRSSSTAAQSAAAFTIGYEIPANKYQQAKLRSDLAPRYENVDYSNVPVGSDGQPLYGKQLAAQSNVMQGSEYSNSTNLFSVNGIFDVLTGATNDAAKNVNSFSQSLEKLSQKMNAMSAPLANPYGFPIDFGSVSGTAKN